MPQFKEITFTTMLPDVNTGWAFKPFGRKDAVFTYADPYRANSPDLRTVITVSTAQPSKTSKLMKVRVKVTMPVAKDDAVTGATLFDYNVTADFSFMAPANSSADARELALEILQKFLGTVDVQNMIVAAEPLY